MPASRTDRFHVITYDEKEHKVRVILPLRPSIRYKIREVGDRCNDSDTKKAQEKKKCRTYVFHSEQVDKRTFLIPQKLGYFCHIVDRAMNNPSDVEINIKPRPLQIYEEPRMPTFEPNDEIHSILLPKRCTKISVSIPKGKKYKCFVAEFSPISQDNCSVRKPLVCINKYCTYRAHGFLRKAVVFKHY